MSVTKVSPSVRAAASIIYAYYGRPADFSRSRAAGELSDFASPMDAVEQMEAMTRGAGRKNQALTIIQSFSKERSEEHTSELQSRGHLVCRLLLEKKNIHKT